MSRQATHREIREMLAKQGHVVHIGRDGHVTYRQDGRWSDGRWVEEYRTEETPEGPVTRQI